MMRRERSSDDQNSRLFYELCALLFTVLRYPPGSDSLPRSQQRPMRLTPAAMASLMFGASLTMMLCGSVTFVLGFVLMPWVIGLVVVLYFVGVVSALSALGRALFCSRSTPSTNLKDLSGFRMLSCWVFFVFFESEGGRQELKEAAAWLEEATAGVE